MISVNGKIPAGSVSIYPTQNNLNTQTASLEKCPDKNAQAIFTHHFQKIKTIDRLPLQGSNFLSPNTTLNDSNHKSLRRSFHQSTSNFFSSEEKVNSSRDLFASHTDMVRHSMIGAGERVSNTPRIRLDDLHKKNQVLIS